MHTDLRRLKILISCLPPRFNPNLEHFYQIYFDEDLQCRYRTSRFQTVYRARLPTHTHRTANDDVNQLAAAVLFFTRSICCFYSRDITRLFMW